MDREGGKIKRMNLKYSIIKMNLMNLYVIKLSNRYAYTRAIMTCCWWVLVVRVYRCECKVILDTLAKNVTNQT